MNFLAHLYLSGNNDEVKIGNFIGDYVKGKDYNKYSPLIRKGILLHRKIDSFTDAHPVVKNHKSLFYHKFHKYAGVITDIIYDHFLVKEWQVFSNENFDEFVDNINELLTNNFEYLPEAMKQFVPNFIKYKWLKSYETLDGIESVLIGMSKGTSLPNETEFALFILKKHYKEIKHDFFVYFPQLIDYVEKEIENV
jgi:acyl carrier protein phosphodiesterase